jgi:hypothetical protein
MGFRRAIVPAGSAAQRINDQRSQPAVIDVREVETIGEAIALAFGG